jgi:putative endonuclease
LKSSTTAKGRLTEDKALNYLENQGLVLEARNFRSRQGEINLIMQDNDTCVFIEVRSRNKNSILVALETIDQRKRTKIIQTSQLYIQKMQHSSCRFFRFDVFTINGQVNDVNIEWIKNAFDA